MTTDWRALEERYFFRTGKRMPVVLVRGQGTRVWDEHGKAYLDFFGGPAAISLGHCHPVVVQALTEQARTLVHVSNAVYSIPQVQFAHLLIEHSAFDRVFFCNSGAEANEGAIKLARKWGKEKKNGAYEIISTENAFHGRTLAMVTAGGTEKYSAPYAPLPPGFVHVPFNDVSAIEKATTKHTVAVFLEPIQGEGGVNVPDDDYLKRVRAWCDERDLLLILDEVQTGFGRTGRLFAYQLYGAEPDIITLAKGIGSGVPLAAFLAKERCAVFTPGDHGTTYGGNPLMTRVGHAVVSYIIENRIPERVAELGAYVERRLASIEDRFACVTQVRGKGLIWAIQFDRDMGEQVTLRCLEEGLIANNVRPNALRITPPLTVTQEEIDEGLAILERVLTQMQG